MVVAVRGAVSGENIAVSLVFFLPAWIQTYFIFRSFIPRFCSCLHIEQALAFWQPALYWRDYGHQHFWTLHHNIVDVICILWNFHGLLSVTLAEDYVVEWPSIHGILSRSIIIALPYTMDRGSKIVLLSSKFCSFTYRTSTLITLPRCPATWIIDPLLKGRVNSIKIPAKVLVRISFAANPNVKPNTENKDNKGFVSIPKVPRNDKKI